MSEIHSRPRRNRGGMAVLPQANDHSSLEAALQHLAMQSAGGPAQSGQGSQQAISGVATVVQPGASSVPPSTPVDLDPLYSLLTALAARVQTLEATTGMATTGSFQVGAQALASGTLVRISNGILDRVTSADAARPVISGITLEAGGPGQMIQVGIVAGVRYTMPTGIPAPSGMLFLGSDGKLTAAAPSTGWLINVGHSESSTIFYLDPDLAILRS